MAIPTTTLGQMVQACLMSLDSVPNFYEIYSRVRDRRPSMPNSVGYSHWESLFSIASKFYKMPYRLERMKIYTAYTEILAELLLEGNEVEIGYLGNVSVLESTNTTRNLKTFKVCRKHGMDRYIYANYASSLTDVDGRVSSSIYKGAIELRKAKYTNYKDTKSESAKVFNTSAGKVIRNRVRYYRTIKKDKDDLQTSFNQEVNQQGI